MRRSLEAGIFIMVFFLLCINLSACSFPSPKPEEGIWYCKELMIEIDFSITEPENCAKIYDQDGNCHNILCYFDYGSLIDVHYEDNPENPILVGNFSYKNGLFTITTTDKARTYVFERIDD